MKFLNQHLIANGVFKGQTPTDEIATAMQRRGDEAVASMPETIAGLDRTSVPLTSGGLMGVDSVRQVASRRRRLSTMRPKLP